jgi:hypothetical protein
MDPNDNPNPPADAEPSVLDAMDAGIAEATPDEPAAVEAPDEAEATQPDADAEPPVPGTEEAAAAEAAKADAAAKPADKAHEPDAEIEQEIADRKLTGKSADRFRELAADVKALAPLREALEKAGVKSPEELGAFLQRNQAMTAVMDMMVDTGATNEQFTQTFDYLGLLHKAGQGDRQAAEQAFEMVGREYAELAKALGKEVPGMHDPLADYADLQSEVESGDITRARALEIAEGRRVAALQGEARNRQQQDNERAAAQTQAIEQGRGALNALEAELVGADPLYGAKKEAFYAKVREVCTQFPPAQWVTAARLAYAGIAAPAPAKPAPGPIRPGGPRPVVAPTTDDPMEALDFGIASAG